MKAMVTEVHVRMNSKEAEDIKTEIDSLVLLPESQKKYPALMRLMSVLDLSDRTKVA